MLLRLLRVGLYVVGTLALMGVLWSIFFWPLSAPRLSFSAPSASSFRLLFLADPQMENELRRPHNERFNDFYLRLVVRLSVWWTSPTLCVVLGDVFSSQWLNNEAFAARRQRFFEAVESCPELVILPGNHDIGYGSETSLAMADRWERLMGPLNGQRRLDENHLLVWLNGMALDGARETTLQRAAWQQVELAKKETASILLAVHVPLFKPSGMCPGDLPELFRAGDHSDSVVSQTLISEESSNSIRTALRPIAVFSGHDHEGCVLNQSEFTGRAIQAEYSGCSMVWDPTLGYAQACMWHNAVFLTIVISALLWPPLMLLVCFAETCTAGRSSSDLRKYKFS